VPHRLFAVLRACFLRGTSALVVPALLAGALVVASQPREARLETTKVATAAGAGEYVPLDLPRIIDTRTTTPLGADQTRTYTVAGTAGVPATGVVAVALSVTGYTATLGSYLSVFEAGLNPRPNMVHLSLRAGESASTTVITKLSSDGKVSFYNNAGTVHLIVDVEGYYTASTVATAGDTFVALTPAQVYSTPDGLNTGASGTTPFAANESRTIQITGLGGVPAGADAVVVNIAGTTTTTATSYLEAWRADIARPAGSDVMLMGNDTQAGLAVVKLSSAGQIALYNYASSTTVKIDVEGYYLPSTSDPAKYYVPLTPARVLSTSVGFGTPGGSTTPLGAGATMSFTLRGARDASGRVMVPTTGVDTVVMSVRAGSTTASSYLTTWTDGETRPAIRNAFWESGEQKSATVFLKLGPTGAVDFYNNAGTASIAIDIQGYFADSTLVPPDAPASVQGTPGDTSVALTWSPAIDNGYPVSAYTVTTKTSAGTVVSTSTEPAGTVSKTIAGLANGQSYVFSVAATNQAGTGPTATSAAVVPRGLPLAPANVTAIPSNRALVATWTAANANGSAITAQTLTVRRASDSSVVTQISVGATATNRSVSGLVNGTTYTVDVVATNAVGTGPPGVSAAVTPFAPAFGTYAAAVVADGPSLYYRLGEPGGPIGKDTSGNGRDGVYDTNVVYGRGPALLNDADNAVKFNGGSLHYTSGVGVPVGNSARSVEAWIKGSDTTQQSLVAWGSDVNGQRFYILLKFGNEIRVERLGGLTSFPLPKSIADGLYHYVVVTYSGAPANMLTVYLDGSPVGSASVSGGLNTVMSGNNLYVGREPNCSCSWLYQTVDDLAVYPVELSAAQVTAHFAASGNSTPTPPGALVPTTGDGFVSLSWSASTGGSPDSAGVDRYVVEASTNGVVRGRIGTPGTTRNARVSGLPAADYVVTVTGCNRWGCGASGSTTVHVDGAAATYASLVQDDAPLSYYRLGERAGTYIVDNTTNHHDATYSTAILGSLGAIGGDPDPAVTGTGSGGALATGIDKTWAPAGAAARTIEGWVKGNGYVAGWGGTTTGTAYGVKVTGTSMVVTGFSDNVTFTTPVAVDNGQWHYVAATFDGTTVTGYFDGVAIGSGSFPTAINTTAGAVTIGYLAGDGTPRTAAIDDVAVYGTALSADRISTHYGAARLYPLVAIDLPAQLAAPTVSSGPTSATVSWTAPAQATGLVRYTVTATSRADGTFVASRDEMAGVTSTTFSGLRASGAYLFTVAAVNNLGAGPASTATSATLVPALATLPAGAYGPTIAPNTVSANQTWGPEHSPYIVNSFLNISDGATLTLLPGTIVKINAGWVDVYGQLVAVGTATQPVVITSGKDDSVGGDSNGDGAATTPGYDWTRITFKNGAANPRVSVLDHVEIRHGGSGTDYASHTGAVTNEGSAKVVISNSRFDANLSGVATQGWATSTGWTSVTNNVFTGNVWGAIRPGYDTDVIGNLITSSNGASIRFDFNDIDRLRYAYNDDYAGFHNFGYLGGGDQVVITRNNFWHWFGQPPSNWNWPYYLNGNYWGHPLLPLLQRCIFWLDQLDADFPALAWGGNGDAPCGMGQLPSLGYRWNVLPGLDAPITTTDAVAAADDAAPRTGPVNAADGTLTYEATDIELNDAGQSLRLTRTYKSSAATTVLGHGWSTNYSAAMHKGPNGSSAVDFASGESLRFLASGESEPGVAAAMTTSGTTSTVTGADNSSYEFDATGVMTAVTLRDKGHRVTLARANGNVSAVTGVSGRAITFGYAGGSLASATDTAGRSVGYAVAGGNLTGVTRTDGGVEQYAYDDAGRLTSVTTPLGRVVLNVGYDSAGRVAWYEQGGAGRTTLEYHPELSYTLVHRPDGVDVRDEYDGFKRMVREVVVGGRTTHVAVGIGSIPAVVVDGVPAEGSTSSPAVAATRLDFMGNPVEEVDGSGRVIRTTFDSAARPLATTYADGGTVTRHYDANGRIDSVTDPLQHVWTAHYNQFGELLDEIDPLARTTASTSYLANGDLDETTDTGGLKTAYGVDAVGRTTSVADPLHRTTSTTYTPWNAVATTTSPRGGVTTTTYDDDRNVLAVTAPLARATHYAYDDSGRVSTITDAGGGVTAVGYDPMSRLERVTSARGGVFSRTFTADGDVHTALDALNGTTTYGYSSTGEVTSVTDATGVATLQTYDQAARLLTRKVGTQNAETRTYDSKGRLWRVTAPRGGTVTTTYDALDRPVAVDDSVRGRTAERTFDAAGRLSTETDARGNTTTFGYDDSDRLATATDEIGLVFARVYDDAGQLLSEADGRGGVTGHTYDPDGNPATSTAHGGAVTSFEYDLAGRVTATVDPLTRRTETDYDLLDRPVTRRLPDGTTETFTYDQAGNVLSRKDRADHTWLATFDLLNHQLTATAPAGGVDHFEYDAAGRPTKTTDADGVVAATQYDTSGRPYRRTDTRGAAWTTTYGVDALPATTTDPDGVSATYGYDAAGRRTSVTDATSHAVVTAYDAADDRISVTDPLGHQARSEYDVRGRLVATVDPTTARTTYGYDDAGNRTTTTTPDNATTTVSYDAADRVAVVTDAAQQVTHLGYDLAGQRTSLTLPRGGVWKWTYDAAGSVASEETPTHEVTTFGYDGEGRLTDVSRPSGRAVTMARDADGRLVGETALDGTFRTHTYTAAGRPAAAASVSGATQWTYDDRGLLTTTEDAGGTATTSYTAGHRVASRQAHGGPVTTAAYNSRGLLDSLSGSLRQHYAYDAAQRLSTITYDSPETGVESFGWDAAGRLLSHTETVGVAPGNTQLSLTYAYDAAGRVVHEVQAAPSRAATRDSTFGYDAVGRLGTAATTVAGVTTTTDYGWDADSNRDSVTTTVAAGSPVEVTSTFDLTGRLTASSDGAAYTYDADGNLVTSTGDGERDFSYDGLGALTGADVAATPANPDGLSVGYARDGLGRMVARDADGAVTAFSYDGTSLDQVEQRSGAAVTSLMRGPGGALVGVGSPGGVAHALLTGHGDLAGLVSGSSGVLTSAAAYDPFGLSSGDTAALPVGYQSDFTDPVTGLVDMGARSYAPAQGRFVALDDVVGDPLRAATLNRYLYGNADPLGFVDPDGHCGRNSLSIAWKSGIPAAYEDCQRAITDWGQRWMGRASGWSAMAGRAVGSLGADFGWVFRSLLDAGRAVYASVADGVVRPVMDSARSSAFARQVVSVGAGLVVGGACGLVTFGAGSTLCGALGMSAAEALDGYLSCPPTQAAGACAARGAAVGFASGLAFEVGGALASRVVGAVAGPVVADFAGGAVGGATASAVGQLLSSGRVDWTRVAEGAMVGGATAAAFGTLTRSRRGTDELEPARIEQSNALANDAAEGTSARFSIHPRVLDQLADTRLGPLQGKLTTSELQELANRPGAQYLYDARSANINVIQDVDGVLLRITSASDEFKIISVGPIRANQVANLIKRGDFIPIGGEG
jgi:RHS repeat-associated protein